MKRNQINHTILGGVIHDNRRYVAESGQTVKEYHVADFDNNPEGWDSVFFGPSWDRLSPEDKGERRANLEAALSKYKDK